MLEYHIKEAFRKFGWTILMFLVVGALVQLFCTMLASACSVKDELTVEPESVVEIAVMNYEEFFGVYEDEAVAETVAEPGLIEGIDGISATADELEMMARVVFLEVGTESETVQRYVADVIVNRLRYGYWGGSLYEVLSAVECDGHLAFSVWPDVDGAETTDEIREICRVAFTEGGKIPRRIMWFASYFPAWCIDEFQAGRVCFSSSPYVEVEEDA